MTRYLLQINESQTSESSEKFFESEEFLLKILKPYWNVILFWFLALFWHLYELLITLDYSKSTGNWSNVLLLALQFYAKYLFSFTLYFDNNFLLQCSEFLIWLLCKSYHWEFHFEKCSFEIMLTLQIRNVFINPKSNIDF